MSFLKCTPSVFVIGEEYEILVYTEKNGLAAIRIGEQTYFEENAGALSTEKNLAKIRIPQGLLDAAECYTVLFRESINRKAYYSVLGEWESCRFEFKPIKKTDGINIYHIADVHYRFDRGRALASYFGDGLDLLIFNGDIGEVETLDNYFEVAKFVGDASGGKIPVLFVRGNHDTRGRLAERFTDFFPADGKNTYYTFRVGPLRGIALDCGEDKPDARIEYGGVNAFESFRRRETEFLKGIEGKYDFAVSHICPAQATPNAGCQFDIEREVYTEWNRELERLGIKFMLCGHIHKAYILEKNDKRSLLPHEYPVIVGSACLEDGGLWGTALTLSGNEASVKFTDDKGDIHAEYII